MREGAAHVIANKTPPMKYLADGEGENAEAIDEGSVSRVISASINVAGAQPPRQVRQVCYTHRRHDNEAARSRRQARNTCAGAQIDGSEGDGWIGTGEERRRRGKLGLQHQAARAPTRCEGKKHEPVLGEQLLEA